jgi:4-amino-4-deoxy-L-arabinose transferase-like glycosyltransferase
MKDPSAQPAAQESSVRPWWREWEVAALAALVIAIYFTRLTAAPVCGEESRWATAAREMIASGDWIVPRQQGAIFAERPPLNSWAMAALGLLRGRVDLVAIRLPSACATLALTLLIYAYARGWMSRLASFSSAIIYATCGQVLALGRFGESEAVFTLFTAGALLVWHAGYLRGWSVAVTWSLGYSLAALGALAKGPQAPVYFASACGAYLLFKRDWRWLFGPGHLIGLVCFGTIVGAWMLPFASTHWDSVDDIWTGLVRERFATVGLAKHFVTFPFETLACLLPWSPLLLVLARPSARKSLLANYPQASFLIVALAVTYPSVWLAAGARGRYYMPLYPCLAVLMGLVVEHCTATLARHAERVFWRRYLRGLGAAVLMGGAALVAARFVALEQFVDAAQPWPFLIVWSAAALVTAGVLVWASLAERSPRPQFALVALAGFLGLAYTGAVVNSRVSAGNNLAPAVAELKELLRDSAELGLGSKPVSKKGTVPFCSEDSAKSGQSPTVLTPALVSFRSVYHRFAYCYNEPIRQIPWPATAAEVPQDVTWFCFDWHPLYADPPDSGSDGSSAGSTPRLPFEWDEIARIACDPVKSAHPTRTVVVGRIRRGETLAEPSGQSRTAKTRAAYR